jgi:hypothetical protein
MSKANNLGDFLTDIANAIRDKTGEFNAINAQNFSTKIKQDGLMTKVVKYDETSGWLFYYGSSQPWHRWASLPNPDGIQIPSTDRIMPKARSLAWKAMTLHDLTTGVDPTVDAFCVSSNDLVVRPSSNAIITNEAEFKAYMNEHPFVLEYLLVESDWGGL